MPLAGFGLRLSDDGLVMDYALWVSLRRRSDEQRGAGRYEEQGAKNADLLGGLQDGSADGSAQVQFRGHWLSGMTIGFDRGGHQTR